MHLLRGVLAAGVAAVSLAVTGCGSDAGDGSQPGTGGKQGAGGVSNSGGADAGVPDAMVDAATGGRTEAGTGARPDLCGNKVVDPGEDCDDGNSDNSDGCTAACRFTCQVDDECSDHFFCNGDELCDGKTHTCLPAPANLPAGTICGQSDKCDGQGHCNPATQVCGDDLVVGTEECDPPDGKGCGLDCRWVCISTDPSRDCTPADECAGTAKCDDRTHMCGPRSPKPNFSPCGQLADKTQCIDGVCSHCGNKVVDPGEECDFGDRINGDGCEYNCKFTCVPSDPKRDCHSTDPCLANGTCNTVTHRCSPLQPVAAGTTCGSGKNCVAGTCIPIVCGDGIKAAGVETCDDGNLANADGCTNLCKPSCSNAATDCKNVPTCEVASCTNNVCSLGPNASKDTQTCSTGGGQGTCHSGACTTGTCGDPNVDAGEQCDLGAGNNVHGSGCEPSCLYSCQSDADCDDGDPCNGVEKCTSTPGGPLGTPLKKACTPGTPKLDGDVCGSTTGPRRICLNENGKEGCVVSTCGDGFTDQAIEDCDPPNTVGCDSACKGKTPCKVDGTWGMKVTVNVSWGDPDGALEPHTGQILQWTMMTLKQTSSGSTQFNATNVKVCGIQIPDFQGADIAGHEWYGLAFKDTTIWDKPSMPVFSGVGRVANLYAGAKIEFDATAILVGVALNNPTGAWPDLASLMDGSAGSFPDHDGDTIPALTLTAKTGSLPNTSYYTPPPNDGQLVYRYPIVNLGNASDSATFGRATKVYIGIRALASEAGTLETCDSADGIATVSSIDNHIAGCFTAPCTATGCVSPAQGDVCTASDQTNADNIKPEYTVADATFSAQRLPGTSPTCATLRQILP